MSQDDEVRDLGQDILRLIVKANLCPIQTEFTLITVLITLFEDRARMEGKETSEIAEGVLGHYMAQMVRKKSRRH